MVSSCRHLMLGLKSSLVLISRRYSIRSATRKRNRVANLPRKPRLNEQAGHVARKRCNQTINVLLRAHHSEHNESFLFVAGPGMQGPLSARHCWWGEDRWWTANSSAAGHHARRVSLSPRRVPLCLIIERSTKRPE